MVSILEPDLKADFSESFVAHTYLNGLNDVT